MKNLFILIFIVISPAVFSQDCPSPVEVFSLVDNVVLSTYHNGYRYIVVNENNILTLERLSTTEEDLPHMSSEFIIQIPLNNLRSMTFIENELYIINLEVDNYKLHKVALNATNPTFSLVLDSIGNDTNFFSRINMISNGSKLYFATYTWNDDGVPGILYTYDTQNPNVEISQLFEFTDNVIDFNFIFSPIILNDTYYFSDTVNGSIYQVDLNAANPEPIVFNTNNGYYGYYLGGIGNFLYMTTGTHPNATLSIFDISSPVANRIYGDVYCNDTVASFFIFEDYFYYSAFRRPLEDFVLGTEEETEEEIEEETEEEETEIFDEYSIFPNPSSNIVFIENLETSSRYELINITGKIVLSGFIDISENTISINSLPMGMYFLKVENQKKYYRILKR